MALISVIIRDALAELGVLNPSDNPSPEDTQFALRTLNRLIDIINTEGYEVKYSELKGYNKPTSGWSNTIVIGDGQDIDNTPPTSIVRVFFRLSDIDYPLDYIPVSEWDKRSIKDLESIPTQYTYQFINNRYLELRFNYIPLSDLRLYIEGVYAWTDTNKRDFDITDDIDFGYAFESYLVNRLAIDLAPSYGVNPSKITFLKAEESLKLIKTRNLKIPLLDSNYVMKRNIYNPARY